jgi:hypothetical protein
MGLESGCVGATSRERRLLIVAQGKEPVELGAQGFSLEPSTSKPLDGNPFKLALFKLGPGSCEPAAKRVRLTNVPSPFGFEEALSKVDARRIGGVDQIP